MHGWLALTATSGQTMPNNPQATTFSAATPSLGVGLRASTPGL